MSHAEIIAELPKLRAEERALVFQRLCELQEDDLIGGGGPTGEERRVLDAAFADFEKHGIVGTPWRESVQRIRAMSAR